MADQNEVMAALEILLEEIVAVVERFRQEAKSALNRGDYMAAREMIDWAERVTNFGKRVKELKDEWQESFSKEVGKLAADKEVIRMPTRRLKAGWHTPRESYRLLILEALNELGGSAPASEVLDRVYEKVKDRLTEYDRQLLPSSGKPRWRKDAEWCRYNMAREGLLAASSARGIWEITQAGRVELSRSREIGQ